MTNKESIAEKLDRFIRENKVGILGSLAFHAIIFLSFVFFEITNSPKNETDFFHIDFISEELLPPDILKKILENYEQEYSSEELKNIAVNEANKNRSYEDYYNELRQLIDNSKPRELFKAEDYEDKRWLIKDHSAEIEFKEEQIQEKKDKKEDKSENAYAGKTIISYFLENRKSTRLPVPAYQCLGSGKVIIEISVNRNGNVVSATIKEFNTPSNENCLPDAARRAALRSKFNIDLNAPNNQKGTITYTFIAQ